MQAHIARVVFAALVAVLLVAWSGPSARQVQHALAIAGLQLGG